ncbi:hypothetical protein FACS189449_03720 [Alphaproteobacteria bacterium]|nr:hypothetical protein FACS189449_03720 [Alphaproteobacteria bacterium]
MLVYPKLSIINIIVEVFSLLCIYGAVFIWFIDRITVDVRYKFVLCVTASAAPVLFINNPLGVAIVAILLMVFLEFLLFEYLRGCRLFDDAIPVYVICEEEHDIDSIADFLEGYKILECVVLSNPTTEDRRFSSMKSTDDIGKWLAKINKIAFFPTPRRLLYFSTKPNPDTLVSLIGLSSEFSVPLFKVVINTFGKRTFPAITPLDIADFDSISLMPQEKSALTVAFKSKVVWIFYDGRSSVLDLVYAIASASSVDITVLCETERLFAEAEQRLKNASSHHDYKIKIVDVDMMNACDSKPDILFYNMPIKSADYCDDILKEAVIKNVIYMNKIIEFAQRTQIPYVFVLSSDGALNANNWIGATQRLGELFAQFADSKSRKLHTKFRIIRIPESATDKSGIFGKIISDIKTNGCVNMNFPSCDVAKLYYRRDILSLLIKMVISALKEYDFSSSVYTLIPENRVSLDSLLSVICNQFLLRKDVDVKITYGCQSQAMDLEDFPNITEVLEKTSINGVLRTKFSTHNPASYESRPWSIAQINDMNTRELVSAVFQSLNEKIERL